MTWNFHMKVGIQLTDLKNTTNKSLGIELGSYTHW